MFLRSQALLKIFLRHAALFFSLGDRAVDLRFGRQHFFALGALKQHFALNEAAEHREPRLGQLHLR